MNINLLNLTHDDINNLILESKTFRNILINTLERSSNNNNISWREKMKIEARRLAGIHGRKEVIAGIKALREYGKSLGVEEARSLFYCKKTYDEASEGCKF